MDLKPIFACTLSTLLSILTTTAASQPNQGPVCPTTEEMNEVIERAISKQPRRAGISLAILHPVCGSYTATFGEADIANHILMNADTRLPIASNTKPILLVLIFKLMEEYPNNFPQGLQTKLTEIRDHNNQLIFTADGKVLLADNSQIDLVDADYFKQRSGRSYDCTNDPVYQCPDLSTVDLHHLLLESSGLADYIRELDLSHDGSTEIVKFTLSKLFSPLHDPSSTEVQTDLEALKKFGLVKKAAPDPIIPMQSHNTDASLLGIILERVSGQSLNSLLQDKILKPLKLPIDSMHFVVTNTDTTKLAARRYTLLNSDEEIYQAIADGNLFDIVSPSLARKLSPSYLASVGRAIYTVNTEYSAIDILQLHGQGIMAFPGPGGIVAQPRAFVRFYQALGRGELLSKPYQAVFERSFIPTASNKNYVVSTGYESNEKTLWYTPKYPSFLSHGGFVPGGESLVMYNYDTGFTIMIATNFSGSWRNKLPFLFVTPTNYFGKESTLELALDYVNLFNIF